MRRLLLGLLAVAALAACSDSPVTGTVSPAVRLAQSVPPTNDLDQDIYDLIGEWPGGLADAILSQWINVKSKYAAGDEATTNQKLLDLASYILKKAPDMDEPAGAETKSGAAARLISYMALFVGGETEAPPAGTDNAAGILMPGVPLTLITPSGHAGTQFEGDETAFNRLIIITQNANTFDNCDGPLPTTRCQYPLFYNIESVPSGPLLNPGVADICLDPHPENHESLRLAHTDPDDSNDIELLAPAATPPFIDCSDIDEYEPPVITLLDRAFRLASALGSRVGEFLTPKSAYAIDQGGGGEFTDFSPFNWVGPAGCEAEICID